jgi:hypothetical protein
MLRAHELPQPVPISHPPLNAGEAWVNPDAASLSLGVG